MRIILMIALGIQIWIMISTWQSYKKNKKGIEVTRKELEEFLQEAGAIPDTCKKKCFRKKWKRVYARYPSYMWPNIFIDKILIFSWLLMFTYSIW